jgi:hypothetical protein
MKEVLLKVSLIFLKRLRPFKRNCRSALSLVAMAHFQKLIDKEEAEVGDVILMLKQKKKKWGQTLDLAFFTVSLFSLLIIYGILQEKIMTTTYGKMVYSFKIFLQVF